MLLSLVNTLQLLLFSAARRFDAISSRSHVCTVALGDHLDSLLSLLFFFGVYELPFGSDQTNEHLIQVLLRLLNYGCNYISHIEVAAKIYD